MLYTETKELQKYRASKRLWQGIPSIEVTKRGRIFLTYLTNTKLFSLQNYLNRILLDIQFMTQSMAGSAEAANALGKMPTITVRMAIAVIGILPLMIIFPFFQSYFARGMTVGAVKG